MVANQGVVPLSLFKERLLVAPEFGNVHFWYKEPYQPTDNRGGNECEQPDQRFLCQIIQQLNFFRGTDNGDLKRSCVAGGRTMLQVGNQLQQEVIRNLL